VRESNDEIKIEEFFRAGQWLRLSFYGHFISKTFIRSRILLFCPLGEDAGAWGGYALLGKRRGFDEHLTGGNFEPDGRAIAQTVDERQQ
jgi:hypothetical protein